MKRAVAGICSLVGIAIFLFFCGCAEETGEEDGWGESSMEHEYHESVEVDADSFEQEVELPGDIEWGNECEDDEDCDDHIDCTIDECVAGYCRNSPDDSLCDDGLKCNGREVCNAEEGCLPGEIFRGCIDNDPCTMDICIEGGEGEAPHCEFLPLDRDGDGHVDIHCEGGDDCNDLSDRVYPSAREWCSDHLDNDCDGKVDGLDEDCSLYYDSCDNPKELLLNVTDEGFTTGGTADIATSCGNSSYTDSAFSFTIETRKDVTIIVGGRDDFYPFVAIQRQCGEPSSELFCGSGQPFMFCERNLEPGTYYIVVSSWEEGSFDIRVNADEPMGELEGDSCENPVEISSGIHLEANSLCMADELAFSCTSWANYKDMFFSFSIAEMSDVVIRVSSLFFGPYVTLFADCTQPEESVFCDYGFPFERRISRLDAGSYIIGVESYYAGQFSIDFAIFPPSDIPVNNTCEGAVDISGGGRFSGSLAGASDDYPSSCMPSYQDVFYSFSLTEPHDVRVAVEGAGMFQPYLVLQSECGEVTSEIKCKNSTPADIYIRSMAEGTYWVVVEGEYGDDFQLDLEILPPTTACEGIDVIDATGTYAGTTVGQPNDFETSTSCGWGAGSPDRAYVLRLYEQSDVVAEITDAAFDTVMYVRAVCDDPSTEIVCDDDGGAGVLSRVELSGVDAGDYILIVDGYGSWSSGNYTLSVTITPSA